MANVTENPCLTEKKESKMTSNLPPGVNLPSKAGWEQAPVSRLKFPDIFGHSGVFAGRRDDVAGGDTLSF